MDYVTWEQSVPEAFTTDPLWRVEAYRLALFLADLGWHDCTRLLGDRRTLSLADQLYRALGGIGSQIGEGYSRGTGRDRARFYEYALGSTRESRDWYYKGRHILGESVVTHRLNLLTQIARLLLVMIPDQRGQQMREETAEYGA
jgi:four helix bundle protein